MTADDTTGLPPAVMAIIKSELGARGMTQRDLATAAGLSEKHVSRLLNGHASTSFAVMQRILEPLQLQYSIYSAQRSGPIHPNMARAAMGIEEPPPLVRKVAPEVEFVEKLSLEHLGRQVLIGGFVENGVVRFRADTAIAGTLVGLRPGKAAQGDNPGTRFLVVAQGSQAAPLETGNRTTVVIEGRAA